jgi:hypothetical protein
MDPKISDLVETITESMTDMAVDAGMDADLPNEIDIQAIVASEIDDAVDYIDNTISPLRAMATEYYRGAPFGNEEDGRSQVVSRDVRDTVQAILPSLMRVFFGSQKIVEFAPNGAEDVAAAEQATDYINYVLTRDNPGFEIFYSAFKDALVRKMGIIKFFWDSQVEVQTVDMSGLDDTALAVLNSDPSCDVQVLVAYAGDVDPQTGLPGPAMYDVRVVRREDKGRLRIAAVPPEELLVSRDAISLDDASIVAHRRIATVSELVAMGYDKDEVEPYANEVDELEDNEERFIRNPQATIELANRSDIAAKKVLYVESYVRIDMDGDGIAELRRICTVGQGYEVMRNEPADMIPFAVFCPDPEPHTFFGLSVADQVMDIQLIKSNIQRNMLDSLALAIHPRVGVVEGQVNVDDVLNTEVGGVIRMRAPGMVQPFSMPFVGQQAFPMLDYMDSMRESRTGITKAAAGLAADSLQSSTRAAVAATVSASQQRIELIARIFAESGMKRLFTGLLKLAVQNQRAERMVRLRGQFVPVDPRSWDANMDVIINIALGGGSEQEKVAVLTTVLAKQEQILQQAGIDNPLVSLAQYRNTLAQILALSGFKDAGQFFSDPAQMPPMPPQQPKPSPEEMLAQAQMAAIQADIQKKAAELELRREEMVRKDDLQRDQMEADLMVKIAEMQARYGAQIDVAQIRASMERDREAMRQMQMMQRQQVPQVMGANMAPGSMAGGPYG